MRSVILKGTEIACINYFILSGQTSHEILELFCDCGGENSQILGGKGSLICGCCMGQHSPPRVRGAAADSRLGTWHGPYVTFGGPQVLFSATETIFFRFYYLKQRKVYSTGAW